MYKYKGKYDGYYYSLIILYEEGDTYASEQYTIIPISDRKTMAKNINANLKKRVIFNDLDNTEDRLIKKEMASLDRYGHLVISDEGTNYKIASIVIPNRNEEHFLVKHIRSSNWLNKVKYNIVKNKLRGKGDSFDSLEEAKKQLSAADVESEISKEPKSKSKIVFDKDLIDRSIELDKELEKHRNRPSKFF